ncbi:hypothetical protein PC110_g22275 [Phytophthora cactorum]|uniref:Uncharacterized protein n=1 Tax=Phytophthora cactorum TaxID=29920 RepID=A0A329RA29_9STRA|nr:hypothetical protein PC110_g22275 [Phytophthora cactorum]
MTIHTFLGGKGSLIAIKTGRKSKTYQSIDWVATESKIIDIWYEGESKSIDEVSDMRLEDPLYHASLLEKQRLEKQRFERKRKGDELEYLNVALKDRRLPDITFARKSTSTTSDDRDSKIKLLWLISNNKEMLESNGLKKSVVPVFKLHGINQDEYVWINNGSIGVYGRESNLIHKASIKKVSWGSTLAKFLRLIKDRGLELTFVGRSDKELTTKPYQEVDDENLEARHGIKTGLEEGMDEKLSIADNDAKLIFEQYYRQLLEKEVMIPFRLKPIVDSKNGVKPHLTYYFRTPEPNRVLNIRNRLKFPTSACMIDDPDTKEEDP